jgi:hypothetical protein
MSKNQEFIKYLVVGIIIGIIFLILKPSKFENNTSGLILINNSPNNVYIENGKKIEYLPKNGKVIIKPYPVNLRSTGSDYWNIAENTNNSHPSQLYYLGLPAHLQFSKQRTPPDNLNDLVMTFNNTNGTSINGSYERGVSLIYQGTPVGYIKEPVTYYYNPLKDLQPGKFKNTETVIIRRDSKHFIVDKLYKIGDKIELIVKNMDSEFKYPYFSVSDLKPYNHILFNGGDPPVFS